ncbi:helix-turn-helix transcriptional regulator [Companilactobacillus mishanensis]|uniref:Helix-turn-helix transcriptional regulator n=1 Tax=Companilactobacillus mishanensis TaxID=2486008 RepID=A0ABW9P722_9LACO|nr:helix-turn-helix transcriptional regulator [Companilactobacillus mishanensis]MQS45035.1 helix-turn-helix transcriptional regulator [Companilactobacillus mishanensis]MQS90292.1 helix-turn-helix transcriptional regulator [Companilactobacillus mishanensis]
MKNLIREKRKEKKLSQEELANTAGVTRQTINAIENDKYDPSLKLAFQLAAILHVRVDELFKWGDVRDEQY